MHTFHYIGTLLGYAQIAAAAVWIYLSMNFA